jgi:hypothetical protein
MHARTGVASEKATLERTEGKNKCEQNKDKRRIKLLKIIGGHDHLKARVRDGDVECMRVEMKFKNSWSFRF